MGSSTGAVGRRFLLGAGVGAIWMSSSTGSMGRRFLMRSSLVPCVMRSFIWWMYCSRSAIAYWSKSVVVMILVKFFLISSPGDVDLICAFVGMYVDLFACLPFAGFVLQHPLPCYHRGLVAGVLDRHG